MATKQKQKSKTKVDSPLEVQPEKVTHGEYRMVPIGDIVPNPWNPNEMSAEEFNILSENMDEVGNLDPLLVVPVVHEGRRMFRIVDGEQRYERERISDSKEIPCIIADPSIVDETMQQKQTVRFNQIKGHWNMEKFSKLVGDLMERGDYTYEEMAHELGFTDEDEFHSLLENVRESLPPGEMRDKFDEAKDKIQTVDDLALVLNRLFTEFGNTIPYNFMILDFGGKDHIWVRLKPKEYKSIVDQARACMRRGYTFDSLVAHVIKRLPLEKYIDTYAGALDEADETADSMGVVQTIDEVIDDGS